MNLTESGLRNRMRELLHGKADALGTFITSTDSTIVELAALAGFDFVVFECEHAAITLETLRNHLRAANGRGLATLVRVPAGDWGFIQRVLGLGADGLLVPDISSDSYARGAACAVLFSQSCYSG